MTAPTAPTAQPVRTERLDLLPLRVEHAEEMAVVLADPALHAFTGGAPLTVPELRARYERLVAGAPDPGTSWCNWVLRLREEGALVGTVQATIASSEEMPVAEISWVVGTPWQGRGLATEAARGLVGWLLPQVGVVIAHVHPDHAASAAVAAACGLRPTDQRQDGEVRWSRSTRAAGQGGPVGR